MPATFAKVTAIIRIECLQRVEAALRELRVSGVSVSPVKGYGEYADFFAKDWMAPYVRIEVFTSTLRSEAVAGGILRAASTGTRGDGIVAIEPVEALKRVRSGASPLPEEL